MKNLLRLTLVSIFAIIAISGFTQEDIVVASDQNLADGEFDQYKTFTFAKHISDDSDNSYFMEEESIKSILKEEIRANLQALNYEFAEGSPEEADLVVNFQVLEEDTQITGWENVDNTAGYWGFNVDAQDRDPEDKRTYDVEKGTIMIHIADREQGVEIWRGFASGIVEDTEVTEDDEVMISEAVKRIFDEYNYTANL